MDHESIDPRMTDVVIVLRSDSAAAPDVRNGDVGESSRWIEGVMTPLVRSEVEQGVQPIHVRHCRLRPLSVSRLVEGAETGVSIEELQVDSQRYIYGGGEGRGAAGRYGG